MRRVYRTLLIIMLFFCLLFFALSAAEESITDSIQLEGSIDGLIPDETFEPADIEEFFIALLETEEADKPESTEQAETDEAVQDELNPIPLIPDEQANLSEVAISPVISPEPELFLEDQGDAAAIEESERAETIIEHEEPDAGFVFGSNETMVEPNQAPDETIQATPVSNEQILTPVLPDEVESTQTPYRSISSEDFSSSTYVSELVLEKTTNGYRAVKDMALVLTINNCSDKVMIVKAALKFETGVADLYETLGFIVTIQSEDIILGAGEEHSMTWTFVCRNDLSSGIDTASLKERNLAFQVNLTCEWIYII